MSETPPAENKRVETGELLVQLAKVMQATHADAPEVEEFLAQHRDNESFLKRAPVSRDLYRHLHPRKR